MVVEQSWYCWFRDAALLFNGLILAFRRQNTGFRCGENPSWAFNVKLQSWQPTAIEVSCPHNCTTSWRRGWKATVLCFYLHFLSLSFTERRRDIQYQRARWELSLSLCISSAFFLSLRVQRSRSNCVLRPRCGCGGSVFSSKGTSQVQV